MEVLFQDRLQVSFDYRLGNAVRYRRYPQRPRPPIVLRYINPTHRRRKIAARGHPIPDLEEVILQILFKLWQWIAHLPQPLPGSPLPVLYASHTSHLEIQNGFALFTRLLPFLVDPQIKPDNAAPSLQFPLQNFFPTTDCSAPVPRIGTLTLVGSSHLSFSLSIGTTGSHVPHKSLDQVTPSLCRTPPRQ